MSNDPYPIGDMGVILALISSPEKCATCVYDGCDCPTCNYVEDINEDEEDR